MDLLGPSLWCLGLFLAASTTEARLTQPKATSASLGDAARLPCTLSTDSITTYTILWFQHKYPSPPTYLLNYKDDSNQGKLPGVSDRFSASKDTSASTCYLTISRVQSEDEGVYFCVTSKGGEYIFGGGTYLTITGQPSVPPKVHLFPPSQEEIKSKDKGTLACLVDGFHPKTIEVSWQADGKAVSSGVQTSEPIKQGEKYVATSYLTVSPSDWESHQRYSCIVTHDGKTFEEEVKTSACP